MWVITSYSDRDIKMFEFETEQEAREALLNIKGSSTFLTEIIYYNDTSLVTN